MDALVQAFRRVGCQYWDSLLSDNRSCIDPGINKMHRAAGDFNAIIEGLFPGLQPGKRGQKRGVDVDDPVLEIPQELAFQHSHEPRQDNQIHLRLAQGADVGLLSRFFELSAEFAGSMNRPGTLNSAAR